MLSRLSIRDIVLIERLDIDFSAGLSVLTGETGAGKSILLDALSLALGARGDASLVRHGAAQGQVSAVFDVPKNHPARAILAENALDDDGDIILRRVQTADTWPWAAPWRTSEASPRAPSASERASSRMDFPAPVSPVRTERPGAKSMSSRSIRTISRIDRRASI